MRGLPLPASFQRIQPGGRGLVLPVSRSLHRPPLVQLPQRKAQIADPDPPVVLRMHDLRLPVPPALQASQDFPIRHGRPLRSRKHLEDWAAQADSRDIFTAHLMHPRTHSQPHRAARSGRPRPARLTSPACASGSCALAPPGSPRRWEWNPAQIDISLPAYRDAFDSAGSRQSAKGFRRSAATHPFLRNSCNLRSHRRSIRELVDGPDQLDYEPQCQRVSLP